MLAVRVVSVSLAFELAGSFMHGAASNEAGAHRPNCTYFHTSFKAPIMPAELSRIVEKQKAECQHCSGDCPAKGDCLSCQQDRCDPEMVSRIWQSVPNSLRKLPNEVVGPFFSKSTALLMVGDSILRQQYYALRRILLESTRVKDISALHQLHGVHAYKKGEHVLRTALGKGTWYFSELHRRDLEIHLEQIMAPKHPVPSPPKRIIIFLDIAAHYNQVGQSDTYEKELRSMLKNAKGLMDYIYARWPMPIKVIVQDPNAQHFRNGDYQDGDQWCMPACSMNTSPNERLVKFREVLDSLGHEGRSYFEVFDAYNATSPYYFAHSSPEGGCADDPVDCTHYCHMVWYFWAAALKRSGLLNGDWR